MTQSFVGTREQVLSALMHAIRQFQRQRRTSSLWSLRTVRTCDCHSAWVRTPIRAFPPVLPGRSAESVFAAKNSVTGDCCGDAGGFSTLRKAARQGTPTSRKSAGVLGSNHLKLSFVGTREQVLSALMHAIRQFQRQRRTSSLWSLRTVRTCDCHSAWVRTPIRAFPPSYRAAQLSRYLRQRIQLRAIAAVTQEAFLLSARRRGKGRRQAERAREY